MNIKKLVKKHLDGTYDVSVEVVLFSRDQKKICLVLEKGGKKTKGIFSFYKTRAWGNPGGGVHTGETPIEGAIREVEEETGFPKKLFYIHPLPVSYNIEGEERRPHHKILFVGKILCDENEFPFQINPVGDTIARKFVYVSELPNPTKVWKLNGFEIFRSDLEHILENQNATL